MSKRDSYQRVVIEPTRGRKVWEAIIFKGGALVVVLLIVSALLRAVL